MEETLIALDINNSPNMGYGFIEGMQFVIPQGTIGGPTDIYFTINEDLIFNDKYYNKLKERFNNRLVVMPKINRSQAMIINNTKV